MDIIKYPERERWTALTERALASEATEVARRVSEIMDRVKAEGDTALREYELTFTKAELTDIKVGEDEIKAAASLISEELREAISEAAGNIAKFHRAQAMPAPVEVETAPGITCIQRAVPIDKVGLYIPGGNSPLFSTVLMLAIPAAIAGCREIALCTPARPDGSIHPAILYAADIAGVKNIYKTGGAGPSEVLVIADEWADPEFVAADFLSQAEHGPDSQSILLTTSEELAGNLPDVIDGLLNKLPRRDMMCKSLEHSRIILMKNDDDMIEFSNLYAPEHLILNHRKATDLCRQVRNAGSVFVGEWSPESVGDYASGTNHTLPTSGYARAYSGVNLDSFTKKVTFQHLTRKGIGHIGHTVETMAENEDLMAHKLAVSLRLNKINKTTDK